jgi:nitrous oxidase accessory protein NosD
MKKRMLTFFAACAMTLAAGAMVHALPSQTFISTTGNDANDCTQSTPCRTFAAAVPRTGTRGVITALDSGSFGIVTVDKALTLQAAPGMYAVLQGGRTDDGVTINAGASEVVVLRNLHIITQSVADNKGVAINTAGAVHIESCVIAGFGGSGIFKGGNCNENGCAQLFVIDTILRDNVTGMDLASVKGSIDHCRIEHNHTGILVQAQGDATIRDSVVSGNSSVGIRTTILGGATVENCVVANNGTGIAGESAPGSFSAVRVSSTTIVANVTGILPNGGHISSFGNNRVASNITNGAFTFTIQLQ